MNEYDVLKMDDEEYLNYCKENCRFEKKYGFLYLFLIIAVFMCTVYQYSLGLYALSILSAFLVGINTVRAFNCFIEYKRWKRVINCFKKEHTSKL